MEIAQAQSVRTVSRIQQRKPISSRLHSRFFFECRGQRQQHRETGWTGKVQRQVRESVGLFLERLHHAAQKKPDVLVCVMPLELLTLLGEEEVEEAEDAPVASERTRQGRYNFHDMLKARALDLQMPIQLARPSTFDPSLRTKEKDDFAKTRSVQDEATCAWNFFVALYYKAGGFPWRLVREDADYKTCFIGISFYEALDRSAFGHRLPRYLMSVGMVWWFKEAVLSSTRTTANRTWMRKAPTFCSRTRCKITEANTATIPREWWSTKVQPSARQRLRVP